jgi:hypothetical protein
MSAEGDTQHFRELYEHGVQGLQQLENRFGRSTIKSFCAQVGIDPLDLGIDYGNKRLNELSEGNLFDQLNRLKPSPLEETTR